MKNKCLAAIALAVSCVMSLFGCSDKHIVDGPGMVNDQPWKSFTLSRTDSNSRYHFFFTVEQGDFAYLLRGECRDEKGNEYTLEEGVELSGEDLRFLRELWLGDLPDAPAEENNDEPIPLDAPQINLVLTFRDGVQRKKSLDGETSIRIYQRFLPYFIKT